MDESVNRLALSLIGPGTLAVFGMGFLWAWWIERERHYLLLLSSACLLFVMGALSQILHHPVDAGLNAVLSNFFYVAAVLAAAQGVLMRSGKRIGLVEMLLLLGVSNALIWYFFYVDRSIVARIYVQNFGFGLIFLLAAVRLAKLANGRAVDRVLFWTLLVFAIQFFPRTMLTVGVHPPTEAAAFGKTLFWQVLQLSLAVLGAGLALAILAAAITDIIDDLRQERDIDRLTGILNRRAFEERANDAIDRLHGRVTLILCDLDHFKAINDSFGHGVGDDVLRKFGAVLRRQVGQTDIVGRVGGEEFAILLRDADMTRARSFVARLQKVIASAAFPLPATARNVTASIGAAIADGTEDLQSLMNRADVALYAAKDAGRDQAKFSAAGGGGWADQLAGASTGSTRTSTLPSVT